MNEKSITKITAAILLVLFAAVIAGFSGCIAFGLQDLNGGALGCGIFGAAALIAFVKVYLAKIH